MAKQYITLIALLAGIDQGTISQGQKFRLRVQACRAVESSDLTDAEKQSVIRTIEEASNPSGYYEVGTGIKAGIAALEALAESAKEAAKEDLTTTVVKTPTLNLTNFTNLVKDGTIFGVEFVKRTTGELHHLWRRVCEAHHRRASKDAMPDGRQEAPQRRR